MTMSVLIVNTSPSGYKAKIEVIGKSTEIETIELGPAGHCEITIWDGVEVKITEELIEKE